MDRACPSHPPRTIQISYFILFYFIFFIIIFLFYCIHGLYKKKNQIHSNRSLRSTASRVILRCSVRNNSDVKLYGTTTSHFTVILNVTRNHIIKFDIWVILSPYHLTLILQAISKGVEYLLDQLTVKTWHLFKVSNSAYLNVLNTNVHHLDATLNYQQKK